MRDAGAAFPAERVRAADSDTRMYPYRIRNRKRASRRGAERIFGFRSVKPAHAARCFNDLAFRAAAPG